MQAHAQQGSGQAATPPPPPTAVQRERALREVVGKLDVVERMGSVQGADSVRNPERVAQVKVGQILALDRIDHVNHNPVPQASPQRKLGVSWVDGR